ncbi:MAG: ATPase [Pyrinomonadaceae bacterium]
MPTPLTILCLASYKKGDEFLRECHRQNCRVLLLISEYLRDKDWAREAIDEMFFMSLDENRRWPRDHVINAVSYLARRENIERIVPLDDFDLETAAMLREHLRIAGMGETTTRYFRDKLAMRSRAQECGLTVPEFTSLINDAKIHEYTTRVEPPWMLKPRSEAAAIGIKKVQTTEELWTSLECLGDRRSHHLLEHFTPGDIYHVDAITYQREILFACVGRYGLPPFEVAQQGGVFRTQTLREDSPDARMLLDLNRAWLKASGLVRGVTHTEFIKGRDDGKFYFLETAARVGGAHIVELVEAAKGINLWAEWAKIEIAGEAGAYRLPPLRDEHAGLLVSLARQENPDTSAYDDAEIVWRMNKEHHVGLIVRSPDAVRVTHLLDSYTMRFREDFTAVRPPLESSKDLVQ